MQGGLATVVGSFPRIVPEPGGHPGLKVAVVRLLTIALHITGRQGAGIRGVAVPLPSGYRAWPSYSAIVQAARGRRRIRFYVCSKALWTDDDRAFPVGTAFVAETYSCDRPTGAKGQSLQNAMEPEFVFVMGKYASMSSEDNRAEQWQTWMYASYGPDGRPLAASGWACGVCRLS